MNNKIINICVFISGAAVGVFATRKYFENKYKKIANDEIDSVINKFSEIKKTTSDNEECVVKEEKSQDATEYETMVEDLGYNQPDTTEGESVKHSKDIYVIPPEIAGDCDYEISSLTYYADNVLTDEVDEVIDDVDNMIGVESLNHFGEFEDDSVFVRNNMLKTDFEILRDTRKYSDVVSKSVHPVKDDQCETE